MSRDAVLLPSSTFTDCPEVPHGQQIFIVYSDGTIDRYLRGGRRLD